MTLCGVNVQPLKILTKWLEENASNMHYLFSPQDLRALFPRMSDNSFKTLLSRTAKLGYLKRVGRGLYAYTKAMRSDGLLLFHAAAYLRSHEFNYLSLETVLSSVGVISQIPVNWISVMSSGRSNTISCGEFGTIEFIHTAQKPSQVMEELTYDPNYGMWCASVRLSLRDMKKTHRKMDLINWDIANELI